jgi:hypothetical protein
MLGALQAMTEDHAAELCQLRGMGLRIARVLTEEAETAEASEDMRAAAQLFPAVARAVRQCQALEAWARRAFLRDQVAAEREAAEAEKIEREKVRAAEKAEAAARWQKVAPVWDRVRNTIEEMFPEEDCDEDDGASEYDRLREDLRTRLDHETFEAEFAHVAYEQVIQAVHRDLGLPDPEFEPKDRIRALIWQAQWGERPEPQPADPPPDRDVRSASG